MSLPSLQLRPISTSHYYISGDVTIQEGAAIAPGVLIQADANSRVVIQAGACIGIGSVLHAHDGLLEVGAGANIGAEVLLIGQVTIGAKACIGSASTILNSTIAGGQVVPPGSLIGDTSRPAAELQVTDTVTYPSPETVAFDSKPEPSPTLGAMTEESAHPVAEGELEAKNSGINVYGQVYVNQLMVKLFPDARKSTNTPLPQQETPPASQDPWND